MSKTDNSEAAVLELLKQIKYPGYSRDIVSFGMIKGIIIDGVNLTVQLKMEGVEDKIAKGLKDYTLEVLKNESGYEKVQVEVENIPKPGQSAKQTTQTGSIADPKPVKGVKRIVAVSSGKGGVGKSTIAVNLAVTAGQQGLKVGLLDADIHGPSFPTLMGIGTHPEANEEGVIPFDKHGIKSMSIGYLIEKDQPLIWRGPMLNKALEQIVNGTQWGELDVLFIDLPPGTGDVQISLSQKYKVDGALVVTTPQNLALDDTHRGAVMFQHTNVTVLGIIENMSYYRCPNCGDVSHPFGKGGGKREAERINLPLLGEIPMDPKILELADRGEPIVIADPESETSKSYRALWQNVAGKLGEF